MELTDLTELDRFTLLCAAMGLAYGQQTRMAEDPLVQHLWDALELSEEGIRFPAQQGFGRSLNRLEDAQLLGCANVVQDLKKRYGRSFFLLPNVEGQFQTLLEDFLPQLFPSDVPDRWIEVQNQVLSWIITRLDNPAIQRGLQADMAEYRQWATDAWQQAGLPPTELPKRVFYEQFRPKTPRPRKLYQRLLDPKGTLVVLPSTILVGPFLCRALTLLGKKLAKQTFVLVGLEQLDPLAEGTAFAALPPKMTLNLSKIFIAASPRKQKKSEELTLTSKKAILASFYKSPLEATALNYGGSVVPGVTLTVPVPEEPTTLTFRIPLMNGQNVDLVDMDAFYQSLEGFQGKLQTSVPSPKVATQITQCVTALLMGLWGEPLEVQSQLAFLRQQAPALSKQLGKYQAAIFPRWLTRLEQVELVYQTEELQAPATESAG
jgi:hypothetical protein